MKKITLLLFLLIAFSISWHAQAQYLTEDFETAVPPTGWTLTTTNAGFTWYQAANPHLGASSAQVDYDPALVPQDEVLTTPVLDFTAAAAPRLKFWFNMSYYWGVDPFDNYDFAVSITDGTTTTLLWEEADFGVFENFTWNEITLDLSAYAGANNIQILFSYVGSDGASLNIDDILIEETPACEDPNTLAAMNISDVAADLSWTEAGTATTWNIEWGTTGFTPGAGTTITGTTTNPYNLSGLTINTSYDFYIQSDCDTNGVSNWVGPFNFSTLSTAPPANDLCANAILLACNQTVTGQTTVNASGGTAASCIGTIGDEVWYQFTGNDMEIELTVNATVEEAQVEVFESTDGTCAGVDTTACFASAGTEENPVVVNFIAASGTEYFIRVGNWINGDPGVDFSIETACIVCTEPTNLTANAITTVSADLGWTENGSATAWDIEWGTAGFVPTGTPMINDTTNPYMLTGLTEDTAYAFYVRSDCDMDDTNVSNWAGPFTFNTAFLPPACGGNFYDSGGASASYAVSESSTTTIFPDNVGDVVTITFTSVDIEASATTNGTQDGCWDFMTIYDGPDVTAPVLAQTLCGEESGDGDVPFVAASELNVGDSFTSTHTSGALTIVFSSDTSVVETGWEANVVCGPLSVEDYVFAGFSYYPNPANDYLTLKAQKNMDSISVYNILGQEVLRTAPNAVNTEVNMSALQSGAYFVKVTIGNATETVRVIKN
ncbi:T9SS type A sorting domain-containing protein [Lacinutrix sp. WUR7]|uniref:T9SS type A sorting domain-containing protein n=1 Tax=Lacinutrix sp. WUR7 TaxID=2653681 RepID=UPI00193E5FA3|nr:T9SS type A sorting domain-containing protein [Lacinutrix sp. WUR7]QRM90904.1 T9SS type A sorting domain-containing protein [Lacinutrix sp. WUR7]